VPVCAYVASPWFWLMQTSVCSSHPVTQKHRPLAEVTSPTTPPGAEAAVVSSTCKSVRTSHRRITKCSYLRAQQLVHMCAGAQATSSDPKRDRVLEVLEAKSVECPLQPGQIHSTWLCYAASLAYFQPILGCCLVDGQQSTATTNSAISAAIKA